MVEHHGVTPVTVPGLLARASLAELISLTGRRRNGEVPLGRQYKYIAAKPELRKKHTLTLVLHRRSGFAGCPI